MTNCGWAKLWNALRIHQNNICIKFAIIVFTCFSLCLVCYFVENPKAKAVHTKADGYQHKLKQIQVFGHAHDNAASAPIQPDHRSTEKLIQIKDFLREVVVEPTKPFSETPPPQPSFIHEEQGSGNYAEVSLLGSSNNEFVLPTESVQLLNDDLFLDYSSDVSHSAGTDTVRAPAAVDDLGAFNENVVVSLQEVPNTDEQQHSSKWSSGEAEYFLNDYSSVSGGAASSPSSTDVLSEEFIISSDDKGKYMQFSETPDDDDDDDDTDGTKYLESPKFINALLGQMSGLLNPALQPVPPSRPVAAFANFQEMPLAAHGALQPAASQSHAIWKSNVVAPPPPSPTTKPFLTNGGASWFRPWQADRQTANAHNGWADYIKLVERFFKGQHYP